MRWFFWAVLALSSAQPESRAGEQSGSQVSAVFDPPDCTPFSISQTPFLESCLWAVLEDFLIPYSKTTDVSVCTTVCGPQSLLECYKC